MNDQDSLRGLWGGLVWGDCVGRLHRGWRTEKMDAALGEDFFRNVVRADSHHVQWEPELRALEPVQRRAFVELGLYGHSTQMALLLGSTLTDSSAVDVWSGVERAMDLDAFRLPNLELVPIMYRMCRRGEPVDAQSVHLFFPMLLVIANHPTSHLEPHILRQLAGAYPAFRALLEYMATYPDVADIAVNIREALDARFGSVNAGRIDEVAALIATLDDTMTVEDAWSSTREVLQAIPYSGSTIGLLLCCRFGADQVVPWARLRSRDVIENLIENCFLPLEEQVEIEASFTHREASSRDEYLAERRAG